MLGGSRDGDRVGVARVAAVGLASECGLASEFGDARKLVDVDRPEVPCVLQETRDLGLPEGVDALLDVADVADGRLPRRVGGLWVAVLGLTLAPKPRQESPLQGGVVLGLVDDEGTVPPPDPSQQVAPSLQIGAYCA